MGARLSLAPWPRFPRCQVLQEMSCLGVLGSVCNLTTWVWNCPGYPTGRAGGTHPSPPPQFSSVKLTSPEAWLLSGGPVRGLREHQSAP